jgi:sugar lactone lactonase YvrE
MPWLKTRSGLGESLLYDSSNDRLIYVDVFGELLHIVDLRKSADGQVVTTHKLADELGVIGLIEGDDQHLIAAAKRGVALVDLRTGKLDYLVKYYAPELEDKYVCVLNRGHLTASRHRANDGCIDAKGRLWAGTMAGAGLGYPQIGMFDSCFCSHSWTGP